MSPDWLASILAFLQSSQWQYSKSCFDQRQSDAQLCSITGILDSADSTRIIGSPKIIALALG